VVTIQFEWEGAPKPISTSFIGTSPQFELALYTLAFGMGKEEYDNMTIGPYKCKLKAYKMGRGRNAKLGTAFPEALPMSKDEAATLLQSRFRTHTNNEVNERSGKPMTKAQKKNAARKAAKKKKKAAGGH